MIGRVSWLPAEGVHEYEPEGWHERLDVRRSNHRAPLRRIPSRLVAAGARTVREPQAPVQVRVFPRAVGRHVTRPVVPRADELAEPPHRDRVLVEPKGAHRRGIRGAGRPGPIVGVCPVKRSTGDLEARATALVVRTAVGQAVSPCAAARRSWNRRPGASVARPGCSLWSECVISRVERCTAPARLQRLASAADEHPSFRQESDDDEACPHHAWHHVMPRLSGHPTRRQPRRRGPKGCPLTGAL